MAFSAGLWPDSRERMRAAQCTRILPTLAVTAVMVTLAVARPARAQGTPASPAPSPLMAPIGGPLLAEAASPDPGQRMRAVATLQAARTPAAANLLVVMLQRDFDSRVRQAAALALGSFHDPELRQPLEFAATADPDPQVRANAEQSRQIVAPFGKRPKLAAGLSVLCPGCGYFYLGQGARAGAYLGAAAGLIATGLFAIAQAPIDPETNAHPAGRGIPFVMAAQNLWFYGIYASYRDARLARGDEGYSFPVAKEELDNLLLAPFNPRVLKSPYVWAGIPLLLGGAIGFGYLVSQFDHSANMGSTMRSLGDPGGVRFLGRDYGTGTGFALGELYNMSLFLPVGVGEEALFRGVVQAGLSESLGLWGGWAAGSVVFGAVHVFNFIGDSGGATTAALAVPYITLTGSYLGQVYIRTHFSLLAGTAIHFWYDFLLSTFAFIADPDNQPFNMRVAIPF
jgi:membrane protease YdiL (CAAX protease family)